MSIFGDGIKAVSVALFELTAYQSKAQRVWWQAELLQEWGWIIIQSPFPGCIPSFSQLDSSEHCGCVYICRCDAICVVPEVVLRRVHCRGIMNVNVQDRVQASCVPLRLDCCKTCWTRLVPGLAHIAGRENFSCQLRTILTTFVKFSLWSWRNVLWHLWNFSGGRPAVCDQFEGRREIKCLDCLWFPLLHNIRFYEESGQRQQITKPTSLFSMLFFGTSWYEKLLVSPESSKKLMKENLLYSDITGQMTTLRLSSNAKIVLTFGWEKKQRYVESKIYLNGNGLLVTRKQPWNLFVETQLRQPMSVETEYSSRKQTCIELNICLEDNFEHRFARLQRGLLRKEGPQT